MLPTWEDRIATTLDELIALPQISPNVSRRILLLLDDLDARVPDYRRPTLDALGRLIQVPAGFAAALPCSD